MADEKFTTAKLEIQSTTLDIKKGEQLLITSLLEADPEAESSTITWYKDGEALDIIGDKIEKTGALKDSGEYQAKGILMKEGFETTYVDSNKLTVTVTKEDIPEPEPEPEDGIGVKYFHELPHRNTAFIQVGYWVIYEISKMIKEGIDWKTEPEKSKYPEDLKTLATMLDKFPDIEVQESRNGYILNKDTLELGY